MNTEAQTFWRRYWTEVACAPIPNFQPTVMMPGNKDFANDLIALYIEGKKWAGSGLIADYESSGDPLPKVGDYWIAIDCQERPRCLLKTIEVAQYRFCDVPEAIAIAEGEGDLSLEYWRRVHRNFFTPFLKEWGVDDLEQAVVVTEFFEMLHSRCAAKLISS